MWRRGEDSNLRGVLPPATLAVWCLRPLGHLSVYLKLSIIFICVVAAAVLVRRTSKYASLRSSRRLAAENYSQFQSLGCLPCKVTCSLRASSSLSSSSAGRKRATFGDSAGRPTEAQATAKRKASVGGRGEIRTRDTLSRMTVFKTVALNHSATLPERPKA